MPYALGRLEVLLQQINAYSRNIMLIRIICMMPWLLVWFNHAIIVTMCKLKMGAPRVCCQHINGIIDTCLIGCSQTRCDELSMQLDPNQPSADASLLENQKHPHNTTHSQGCKCLQMPNDQAPKCADNTTALCNACTPGSAVPSARQHQALRGGYSQVSRTASTAALCAPPTASCARGLRLQACQAVHWQAARLLGYELRHLPTKQSSTVKPTDNQQSLRLTLQCSAGWRRRSVFG